jgi:hypothetical protein
VLAGFLSAQAAVWVAAHHASLELEDDAACAALDGSALIGPHHQDGLQFEDTNPPCPIDHCALCHLQRAFGSARLARVVATDTAAHVVCAPVEPALAVSLFVARATSPRGPPSFVA